MYHEEGAAEGAMEEEEVRSLYSFVIFFRRPRQPGDDVGREQGRDAARRWYPVCQDVQCERIAA